jgi:23S rRNA (guanosine2251-2'-O)-methyltransferase
MPIEILYGIHPVLEALRAGRRKIHTVFLTKAHRTGRLAEIEALTRKKKIAFEPADGSRIAEMCGSPQHQGVAARVDAYPFASLDAILAADPASPDAPLLLLLDSLVDPHNLGALLRTAFCAGVDGVVVPKHNSAPPSPTVSKISAGALEHVALARVTNLVDTIARLKKSGFWVHGLDGSAKATVFESDLTGPLALVVGGEAKGLRPLIKKKCDLLVSIPQTTRLNSLNASVAGAVVLYEALRQRTKTLKPAGGAS